MVSSIALPSKTIQNYPKLPILGNNFNWAFYPFIYTSLYITLLYFAGSPDSRFGFKCGKVSLAPSFPDLSDCHFRGRPWFGQPLDPLRLTGCNRLCLVALVRGDKLLQVCSNT